MIDYKMIGKRIQQARTNLGLTQEVLAEAMGVSANYLNKVETGRERPNLEMLAKLSVETQVPLPLLLTDVVEKDTNHLSRDMAKLLKACTPEKRRLIYEVAERIAQWDDGAG